MQNLHELTARCRAIAGRSFIELASLVSMPIPSSPLQRKGFIGMVLERALGTTALNKAVPDFEDLGIELKTLPLNPQGLPAESTFVTSISLLTVHQEVWHESSCYKKLQKILWVPIEGDKKIPFAQRRIGTPFLWTLTPEIEEVIKNDWLELSNMIGMGQLENITAFMGRYLQVRPKAAHALALCDGFDSEGNKIRTLPRGFYLRSSFTGKFVLSAACFM